MRRASRRDRASERVRVVLPVDFSLVADETTGSRLRQLASDDRVREIFVDGHQVVRASVRALGLLVAVSRIAAVRGAFAVVIDPSPPLTDFIVRLGLADRLLLVPGAPEPERPALRSVPVPS